MNIIARERLRAATLTDGEVAEIRSRKAAVRASLACEGMHLTDAEETFLDGLLDQRLPPEEGERRIVEWFRARQRQSAFDAS